MVWCKASRRILLCRIFLWPWRQHFVTFIRCLGALIIIGARIAVKTKLSLMTTCCGTAPWVIYPMSDYIYLSR